MSLNQEKELAELSGEQEDDLFEHHRITTDPKQSLIRVDKFLMDRLPNATRNKLQNAIEAGAVQVNGKQTKSSYKVKPHDVITVTLAHPPRDTDIKPENIALDIVFEDEDILLVNKPAGMVVHPAYNNWSGTLVNALVYHFQNLPTHQNGEARPGLVHRIDKDTSGLLVIAKTDLAMASLAKQFYEHTIERTYYALVWGVPKEESGTITAHVGRSLRDRKVMAAYPNGEQGKHAVTHFKLLRDLRYVSLLKCNLETGRTHQIRAHMKFIGHPLFNDASYGGDKILKGTSFAKYRSFVQNTFDLIPRQALHAKSLGFEHPRTKQWLQFETELPSDFSAALQKWEHYVNEE